MNEQQLAVRLHDYFAPILVEDAPAAVRAFVDRIPGEVEMRRGWRELLRSRPALAFATLALVAAGVGAAILIGYALQQPPQFVPPAFLSSGLIAFESNGDIFVVNADGTDPQQLTSGASVDTSPKWSSDGTMIAFWREGSRTIGDAWDVPQFLVVMNGDGSNARVLAEGVRHQGEPAWSPDDQRIAFTNLVGPGEFDGLQLEVAALDGSGRVVVVVAPNLRWGLRPRWSPDARQVAFAMGSSIRSGGLHVASADGRGNVELAASSLDPRWSPDGLALAYVPQREAAPDGGTLRLISPDGTGDRVLVASGVSDVRGWSPDGTRLAYGSTACCGPTTDTWIVNRDGTSAHPVTDGSGTETFVGWSPDGLSVLMTRGYTTVRTLVIADADGLNRRDLDVGELTTVLGWSPDGTRLLATDAGGLVVIDPSGAVAPTRVSATRSAVDALIGASWQGLPSVARRAIATPWPAMSNRLPSSSTGPAAMPRRFTSGFDVPFSFESPDLASGITRSSGGVGWQQVSISPHAYSIDNFESANEYGLTAFSDARLYADPCHPSRGFADTGFTPTDLAAALATLPGFAIDATQPATLDGFAGITLDFHTTVTDAGSCEPIPFPRQDPASAGSGLVVLVQADPGVDEMFSIGGEAGGTAGGGDLSTRMGATTLRWLILDVRGKRLILEAWQAEGPSGVTDGILPSLVRVIATIRFE